MNKNLKKQQRLSQFHDQEHVSSLRVILYNDKKKGDEPNDLFFFFT